MHVMSRQMTDEEIAERFWRVPVWEMSFTILQHLRQIAYLRERFDALERCHDRLQQQYMHVVDLHARVLSECEQLWQTCLILQFHLHRLQGVVDLLQNQTRGFQDDMTQTLWLQGLRVHMVSPVLPRPSNVVRVQQMRDDARRSRPY